jgi:hypothetical protein
VADPPSDADPDGDYLTDAEEAELGTDPTVADTDGDSYLDGDEVLEGSDPLDPTSRIYQGGWPYQRFKADIVDPGFASMPAVGAVVPRLISVDQFGDQVDLYDFALHGKPVVIDLSGGWCQACRDMAVWLEGKPSNLGLNDSFAAIPGMVEAGEIYWVTVLFEDASTVPADASDVADWYASFPNPHVLVIADDDRAMYSYMFPGSYPSLQILEEDMTLRVYDRYNYEDALTSLLP